MTVTTNQSLLPDGNCSGQAKVERREENGLAKKDQENSSRDTRTCFFPSLDSNLERNGKWQTAEVPWSDFSRLSCFRKEHGVSAAAVLQTVWAIVLRVYLGSDSVCFGFNASSPEATTNGKLTTRVPCFKNTCFAEFNEISTVLEQIRRLNTQFLEFQSQSSPFMPAMNRQSKSSAARNFNTAIWYVELQDGCTPRGSILHKEAANSLSEVSADFGRHLHPSFGIAPT